MMAADHIHPGAGRVRARAKDPFEGLKGHAYIQARGLTPRPNHSLDTCPHCALQAMLPAVQNIVSNYEIPKQPNYVFLTGSADFLRGSPEDRRFFVVERKRR